MPQLRRDPITGRWVIVAAERARRPQDFAMDAKDAVEDSCPFCMGCEQQTPLEIFALRPGQTPANQEGWETRVVPSKDSMLQVTGELNRRGNGIYDLMDDVGAHEIIIETPQHIANLSDVPAEQIKKAIDTYIARMVDLERDSRIKYGLIFKNYGTLAGATMHGHSHSQLIALPVNPKLVKTELMGTKRYFDYRERCIFCDMITQELDSQERIILDTDGFVVLAPFASRFPFEAWILPKKHCCDFPKLEESNRLDLARTLKVVLSQLKVALGDPAYNFILHTAPFRRGTKATYWKTIEDDYHWHIEIMPRIAGIAGFEWGSDVYINSISPEEAAKYLRELEMSYKDA